ncbi:MAG: hypothetical protein R3E84_02740 [Pseudomonadales bacterium]
MSKFRRYSNENLSRIVVYLSPYLFWIVLSLASAGMWLFLA